MADYIFKKKKPRTKGRKESESKLEKKIVIGLKSQI